MRHIRIDSGTSPLFGKALRLDGINQYGNYATPIAITTGTTISVWFKAKDTNWDGTLFGDSTSNTVGCNIQSPTSIHLINGTAVDFAVPAMSANTRYHCMIGIGATTTKLFLNAVESSSGALSNRLFTINQVGKFGTVAPTFLFNGEIDEIAIWNGSHEGVLQDAIDLYNSGNGELATNVIASPDVYTRFNDSDGTDSSGNGNTMTLFNSPTFPTF